MIRSEEFIGAKIRVLDAPNKSLKGFEGFIIDETKNTFRIKIQNNNQQKKTNQEKTILKKGAVFLINSQRIDGDEITRRPEERIKLKEKLANK
jgi:RNase P/RNase MRP subunit p29